MNEKMDMSSAFREGPGKNVLVYLDDILVYLDDILVFSATMWQVSHGVWFCTQSSRRVTHVALHC